MYDLYTKHFKSSSFKRKSFIAKLAIIIVAGVSVIPYTICYCCMVVIDVLEKEER
jgi:hypothetical protein